MITRLLTPQEVAEALQLHHLTVLKLIREKKLKSVKFGRVYRIKEEDLTEFLKKQSSS